MAGELATAFVRMRPDFSGFKTDALDGATKALKGMQTSVTDTENAVKRAARENISQAVAQKESLNALREEYLNVAKGAQSGSEIQRQAYKMAADAAKQMGESVKTTSDRTTILGRHSSSVGEDVGKAGRGALAASGAFEGLGRSLAFASSSFLGAAGFVEVAKRSVEAATDLQDQVARTDTVFGKSAAIVQAWSKTSANAMGITRAAALDGASTIGTLLQNIGETAPAAAKMSTRFVQLASDMAAFKKVDPNVALSALESGIQGRTRSLRQFGIMIDNTTIKAEALRMGLLKGNVSMAAVQDADTKVGIAEEKLSEAIKKHGANSVQAASATVQLHTAEDKLAKVTEGATGTLTTQQKSLATMRLILEQTKNQQGEFAKSSDELNVEQMKLHAALTNLEAEVGTALLPTITKYTGELANWIQKTTQSKKFQDDLRQAVSLLKDALSVVTSVVKDGWRAFGELSDVLKRVTPFIGGAKGAMTGLIAAFAVNKIRAATTDLITLGIKAGLVGTAASTAEGEATVAFAGISVAAEETGFAIKGALVTTGIGAAIVAVGILGEYVATHWSKVKKLTEELGSAMEGTFKGMWQVIEGLTETAAGVMTTYITAPIRALLEGMSHLPFIGGKFKDALNALNSVTTNWVTNGVKTMKSGGEQMGGAWAGAFGSQTTDALNTFSKNAQTVIAGVTEGVASINAGSNLFGGGAQALSPISSGKGMQAQIASIAKQHGLDPRAVLAVASAEGGFSGAVGDGGHAFGPFQLNNAGGVITKMFPGQNSVQAQQFATSTAGLIFAISEMAKSAKGLTGMAAVDAIVKNFERPKDGGTGDEARAAAYLRGMGVPVSEAAKQNGAQTPPAVTVPTVTMPSIPDLTSGAVAKVKTAGQLTASAVASLKQQLATLADTANGLAPGSLRTQVEAQITALTAGIHKGLGPTASAGIRADVAALKKSVNADLSMDKSVTKIRGNVSDMRKSIASLPPALRSQVAPDMAKLRTELSNVSDPTALAAAQKAYASLKKEVTDDLNLAKAVDGVDNSLAEIRAKVTALPPAMRAQITPQMSALRTELANVTDQKSLTAAKNAFKSLSTAIATDLNISKAVTGIRNSLDGMKAEVTALPASLSGPLSSQMAQVRNLLSSVTNNAQLTAAKNAFKALAAEFQTDLTNMKSAASDAKSSFENAFSDIKDAADSVFDREIQNHLTQMTNTMNAAVAKLDAQLAATNAQLDAQSNVQTPAEKALADLQAAHDQAQLDNQIAADKAALAANTDPTQVVALQSAIDADLYNEKVAALQKQAEAERSALNASIEAQRTAAQTSHDTQVNTIQAQNQADQQAYQDQMDEQKKFFDNWLASQATSLEAGTETWSDFNQGVLDKLGETFGNNPDWDTQGAAAGTALVKGLTDALSAAEPVLESYKAAAAAVASVTSAQPGGSGASAQDIVDALGDVIKHTSATADAVGSVAEAIKTQKPVHVTTTMTSGGYTAGSNINQVARDALR